MKAPNWKPDAVISTRGWKHPRTGELLVSRKFTQEQVDRYNASLIAVEEVELQPDPEPEVTVKPKKKRARKKKVEEVIENAVESMEVLEEPKEEDESEPSDPEPTTDPVEPVAEETTDNS